MARTCSNCHAMIPRGMNVCPECGVFDGELPKQRRKSSGAWIVLLLLVAAGGTGRIRVVGDRAGGARRAPGAAIKEPEGVMTLRHYFAAQEHPIKSECIAVISKGFRDGNYIFDAVNACDRTRLGRWKVDSRTKAVSK